MNSLGLLRVAAEAELLRIRILLKRQAWRGAYGGIAGVFGLSVLAVANVLVWQLLRLAFGPIETTAILLGINLALMAIFGWLAARSTPSLAEREALRVRQDALSGARNSLLLTGAVMAGRGYLNRRRRRVPR